MLKQCPSSPAEADTEEPSHRGVALLEDKKQDVEDVEPASQNTAMTTATSPPPPPPDTEQAQHRAGPDADGPASAAMEVAVDHAASPAASELAERLVCAVCDAVLATEAVLASHLQELGLNHAGGGDEVQGFGCRVCQRVFEHADTLDRHVLTHPGEQVFKCPLCGQALRTNGGLARHARRHLDGHMDLLRPDLASVGRTATKRHLEMDDTDYEVEAKQRSPANDDAMRDPAPVPAPPVPHFTCPVCPASNPFRAPYLPELEAHLEHNHRDYSVSCDLCGGTYRSVRDLNLHMHTAHRSGGKASRGRDVVGFKDLTFVDFSSRKFAHIARAECEKSLHRAANRSHPFQCECGLAFPCDSALAIHRQACPNTVYVDSPADLSRAGVHLDGLPAQSPKGDFFAKLDLLNKATRLAPPAYLDRDLADIPSILSASAASGVAMGTVMGHHGHSSEHGEERDDHEEQQDAFAAEFRRMKQRGEFPCRLCTEVFPNLRALKGHNRVHMGPSADGYRCNMCPHAAMDKVALQRHMRTHNGARPYECALCRFAFTTKANCERHLRNRHAKCSRDEVKSSIIYHPSEDPGNDPELQQQLQQHGKLDVKRSLFAEPSMEDGRRHSLDVGTMTASEDDDDQHRDEQDDNVDDEVAEDGRQSPLDLSMVLDLSKKRPLSPVEADMEVDDEPVHDEDMEDADDQPQDLSRKASTESAAAPATQLHANNQSTPLQSPEAALPFPGLGSLYVNPYQLGVAATGQGLAPGLGQGLGQGLAPGLPFPAYYPGLLRSLQFGQLGGGLVLEPMRLLQRPPFLGSGPGDSPLPVPLPLPQGMTDVAKDEPACPASPKSERSMSSMSASECPPQGLAPSSGSSTGSNGSSKMVMKNGVLMPKQKQRRYRTERPHVCEHCSARFTLSSNRERHVKHQHPQFWSQRHRGPSGAPPTPPTTPAPPTPMDASTPLRAPPADVAFTAAGVKHPDEDDEDEGLVIDEERPSSEDHHHHDDGLEGDEEEDMHPASAAPSTPAAGEDLASVSKLLNNTSIQTFRQFLRDGDEAVAPSTSSARDSAAVGHAAHEEGLGSEEDLDEEGLVAGSPEENNSGSEQDKSESESAAAPMKKKSAYSMAPNRVSCPYCSRKFPWTSSLRRHVLTHTGQKPYKCLYCPLLFTTKSNCDRHLARKHSNKKDANSSSSGVSTLSTPNSSTTSVSPGSSAGGGSPPEALLALTRPSALSALSPPPVGQSYPLRNVPERPYRCRHCPSSTFATLSNLRKHVATKHTGASLESCILPSDAAANVSGYESHGSVSDVELVEDKAELEMKIPVFCPSLDQPLSLCKAEVKLAKSMQEQPALNLRRPSELDRDIMREAHNSLMSSSPAAPISAPVVSIPEGNARPAEASMNLSSSELPFKCHLCDGSFTERQECLDHIRLNHASEYEILLSKGALDLNVNTSPEDNGAVEENHHADGENIEHIRGKFPDYANRKVMCAFCMRRFWSAEDLRRHMRTHTGERPFSCDVCRRRFTLKHSMLRHRKKHSDISNNNNNSIGTPFLNSTGPEDLSPSATSGEEEGYHVNMTNHNNNNINVVDVNKMYMAICDNRLNLKRNFRRNNFRRKEEENSGLISNLLGIGDPSIIDKVLLTKSADDAEKLLGVTRMGV